MRLGLGTAALGRPQYINIRQETEKTQTLEDFKLQSLAVLDKAYSMGIRYFDTAPGYGMAEQLILDWQKAKNDPSIAISTKWGYTYVANFDPSAKIHEIKEHSLTKLNQQWKFSKAFLPHLKIYQIHSATLETGVLENDAVLNQLLQLKKEYDIEIGITTTGANQMEVIKKALDVSVKGIQLFDSFQVTYNILEQNLLTVLDILNLQNKTIIIKEALANGRLFRNKNYKHYFKMYDRLEQLASKYQVGVDAIALSYCAQTISKSVILSGASNKMHLNSNLDAENITLTKVELESLNAFGNNSSIYWNERKQLVWQ